MCDLEKTLVCVDSAKHAADGMQIVYEQIIILKWMPTHVVIILRNLTYKQ